MVGTPKERLTPGKHKRFGPNNLTEEGRKKAHGILRERYQGWPSFIKNDLKREALNNLKMNGRRYDEPGMEVRFKKS